MADWKDDVLFVQRNHALVFAQHTRANLRFIEEAYEADQHVHTVTQLVNSLLGLIVFVWEKKFAEHVGELRMDKLAASGWPKIEVTLGDCKSLRHLLRHMRNAVAHGRMTFSSDSRDLRNVIIEVEDCKPTESTPNWVARMTAADLRDLCFKLMDLLQRVSKIPPERDPEAG